MQLAWSGVFGSSLNSCTSTLTASTCPLLAAWCSAVLPPYSHRAVLRMNYTGYTYMDTCGDGMSNNHCTSSNALFLAVAYRRLKYANMDYFTSAQQRTYSTQLFHNVPLVLHNGLAMQGHNLASEGHLHCPCSQVDS